MLAIVWPIWSKKPCTYQALPTINSEKSDASPLHGRLHLGFVVDLAESLFKVSLKRWKAFCASTEAYLNYKVGRAQAQKLASLVITVISMKLAWGHITQLYTRNFYRILNTVLSLNCWVTVCDQALNELLFWKELRRESDTWPSSAGYSIKVATNGIDIGWGGHTLNAITYVAHEHFSEWEAVQSSTYRANFWVSSVAYKHSVTDVRASL